MKHSSSLVNKLKWFIPNGGALLLFCLLILTQRVWATPAQNTDAPGPSAATINYQGHLTAPNGVPKNGSFDMSFAIYNAASGGTRVWGPENHNAVPVSNGIFNIGLGSKTSGGIPTTIWNGDRYLQITVGGETLTPRELIRSVPIAGMALAVPDGAITARNVNLNSGEVGLSGGIMNITASCFTFQDVPGTTQTITVDTNVILMAHATFDMVSTGSYVVGVLNVDGSSAGRQTVLEGNVRGTVGQSMRVPLSPGTHTIKLQVCKAAGGSNAAIENHTTLSWFLVGE
ncbi:MAG: hypothetical protein R6X34_07135 [Chloroflexota bacterium]